MGECENVELPPATAHLADQLVKAANRLERAVEQRKVAIANEETERKAYEAARDALRERIEELDATNAPEPRG